MNSFAAQEEEYAREFHAIDADGDGQLTREEYLQAFTAAWAGSEEAGDEAFQARMVDFALMEFDGLDLDGSGTIDLEEFLYARTETDCVSEDYITFLNLDTDGNGTLSVDELLPDPVDDQNSPKAAEYLGRKAALERYDVDGDGKVSLDEWLAARKDERRVAREARRQAKTW